MNAGSSRNPARVRFKTSCTECQRRRKKCNKGRPCSNCARRYPPVECVYEAQRKQESSSPAGPNQTVSQNQRLLASRPNEQPKSLPALSSLNLPDLVCRSSSNFLTEDGISSQSMTNVPNRSMKLGQNLNDVEPEKEIKALPRLPSPRGIAYGTSKLLRDLSVEPTISNAQLFHLYFNGIFPALWSADGNSPAPPIIHDFWIPFMTSSPIIVHALLLRAAIWRIGNRSTASEISAHHLLSQNQWMGTEESLEILTLKSKSISLLNERLRAPGGRSIDDEAIASVIQHFYNEWCWGVRESFDDLSPHAKGLREMLRIRGGIKNIHTKGDFMAQLVMLMNYHLAVILERESYLCPPSEHNYQFIPTYQSPKKRLDSPLYRARRSPEGSIPEWGTDDATSQILESMTFITSAIHSYMSTGFPKLAYQQWMLKLEHMLNELLALSFSGSAALDTLIYDCCRLTAIVYLKAVIGFMPFSIACTPQDLDIIYSTMNLIPISRWMQISGVWLWVLCVINPCSRYRFEGLRLRMFLKNVTSALGLIDWQILINCMESFLSVQRWIRERGKIPLSITELK